MIVSFIIPALNEEKNLGRCLASIRDLTRPREIDQVEIVVVDNSSTDGTVEVARSHGSTIVQVEPGSVSRARNRGVGAARGDLLAFVDADCELDRQWLSRLMELCRDPNVVAAGTELAPPDEHATWVEKSWHRLAHRSELEETRRVDWLASFNLLVRKDAFLACGGFDESLVTCEDVDLSHRLSQRGVLLRDAAIRTRHHGESKTLGEFFRREAWRGRGSVRSLVASKFDLRELRSVLAPLGFLLMSLAAVTLLIWSAVARQASMGLIGAGLLLAAASIPAIAVSSRALRPWRSVEIGKAWTLMAFYLAARAIGLFGSVQRVSRR